MFVNEIVALICAKTRNFNLPIAQGMESILAEQDEISARIKAQGHYFHEPSGSIFMDYKIMRGEAYEKLGKEMGKIDPDEARNAGYQTIKDQFNQNMTTDEALVAARNFIAQWKWN